MSELAKKAREERAAKAKRYSRTHDEGKVDASDFKQAEPLEAEAKTGLRPISRRQFKRGGKVEGEHAHHHAGRKPRKSGGRAYSDSNPFTSAAHGKAPKGRTLDMEMDGGPGEE